MSTKVWQFAVEPLLQSFSPLTPSTVFPSFDYVTKPYADALDSIASILILWSITATVCHLISVPFGMNTRSLAVRDAYDRLVNMKISCNCSSHVRSCGSSHTFSNFSLRIVAFIFFVVSIGVEVLIIFTQSTIWKTRSLDDLNLRRITLAIPDEVVGSLPPMFQGCEPLLLIHPSSTSNLLSLCAKFFVDEPFTPEQHVQFHFVSSDRFFAAFASNADRVTLGIKYSIELNDPLGSTLYYANMTRLGFKVSSQKLRWILKTFAGRCPLCNATAYFTTRDTPVISSELNETESGYPVHIVLHKLTYMMIKKSKSQLMIRDFVSGDATDSESKSELREFSRGKVKRLSGLILWIAAAVVGIINWIVRAIVWDMDRDSNNMVKCMLDLPADTSLVDSPNIQLCIVEEEPFVCPEDGECGHTERLRLRRRIAKKDESH